MEVFLKGIAEGWDVRPHPAAKMRDEAEQMRLENKKRRFELQRDMLQLAVEIVSKMKPDLPIAEQYAHAVELLPSDKLATSEIEPSLLLP